VEEMLQLSIKVQIFNDIRQNEMHTA